MDGLGYVGVAGSDELMCAREGVRYNALEGVTEVDWPAGVAESVLGSSPNSSATSIVPAGDNARSGSGSGLTEMARADARRRVRATVRAGGYAGGRGAVRLNLAPQILHVGLLSRRCGLRAGGDASGVSSIAAKVFSNSLSNSSANDSCAKS